MTIFEVGDRVRLATEEEFSSNTFTGLRGNDLHNFKPDTIFEVTMPSSNIHDLVSVSIGGKGYMAFSKRFRLVSREELPYRPEQMPDEDDDV